MSAAAAQNPPAHFAQAPQQQPHQPQAQPQAQNITVSAPAQFPPASHQDSQNDINHQLAQQSAVPVSGPVASLMQLRAEIPPAPPMRQTRKRKSPSSVPDNALGPQHPQPPQPQQQQQPPPQQPPPGPPQMHPQHPMHQPPNVYAPMTQYGYPGQDYSTGGMLPPGAVQMQDPSDSQGDQRTPIRQLSTSKRAEQNRKAQRAFRERRDQHVKALESRSQLLDAALASADEANRRWEECRALLDQLRIENAALRTTLQQAQGQLAALGASDPNKGDGVSAGAEAPKDSTAAS